MCVCVCVCGVCVCVGVCGCVVCVWVCGVCVYLRVRKATFITQDIYNSSAYFNTPKQTTVTSITVHKHKRVTLLS